MLHLHLPNYAKWNDFKNGKLSVKWAIGRTAALSQSGAQRAVWVADVKESQSSFWSVRLNRADADFTHRQRRTVSTLRWRWGEGRKNSERSRACSHTSHSYSTRGPGTHLHLQRAPQTLVTVWTSAMGQLLWTGGGHSNKSTATSQLQV